jgi:hypothetical protein
VSLYTVKTLAVVLFGLASLTAWGADLPPINNPATAESYPGKFVWADLFTSDPAVARGFYAGMFGWTAATVDRATFWGVRHYVVLSAGGRPVAGIVKRPARKADEIHGRWVGYVSVPDVARSLAAAISGGGRVLSPTKALAARGTQAIFADPDGASLGLMHSTSGDPGEYLPNPGDWVWAELFARDPGAASAFYHAVAGYDVIADTRAGRPGSFVLVCGGYSRASVSAVSDRPRARPAWLLFVRVENVRDAAAKAVSLGGRVLVPPSDGPTEYWRAIIADPTGAPLGIVEIEDAAKAKEGP